MYSSYTTLQRVQLAKQEYLDTQEVFLGVYAPGRNAALKASLQDQLHRKFLLTDSLRPEALGSAVGVLLVREDLFLMPTALSCFADALRSGADYVTSDAVFGYSASPPSTTVRLCSLPGLRTRLPGAAAPLSGGSPRPGKSRRTADAGGEAPPQPRLPPAGAGPL